VAVSLLDKGEVSPSKGYLFSIEEAKKIQVELMELDFCKQTEQQNNILIELNKTEILKYKEMTNSLEIQKSSLLKENQELNKTKLIENGLYFLLGVILTSGIVYVTK
jgi:hypothetical protein